MPKPIILDVWMGLWEIANRAAGTRIVVDKERATFVTLEHADGSHSWWVWEQEQWVCGGTLKSPN